MNLKTPVYIILGLAAMYFLIRLATPKPTLRIDGDLVGKIENLTVQLEELKAQQATLYTTDSTLLIEIWALDDNITEIRKKTDQIGVKYNGAAAATGKYTPNQVDSFYRQRYKY
jgi:hypothetical protein